MDHFTHKFSTRFLNLPLYIYPSEVKTKHQKLTHFCFVIGTGSPYIAVCPEIHYGHQAALDMEIFLSLFNKCWD